jgi:hypothetical protein
MSQNKFISVNQSSYDFIKEKLKKTQVIGKYLDRQQRFESKMGFQKASFMLGDEYGNSSVYSKQKSNLNMYQTSQKQLKPSKVHGRSHWNIGMAERKSSVDFPGTQQLGSSRSFKSPNEKVGPSINLQQTHFHLGFNKNGFLTSNKEFFKNENTHNSMEEIADRINQDGIDKKARILRQRSQQFSYGHNKPNY